VPSDKALSDIAGRWLPLKKKSAGLVIEPAGPGTMMSKAIAPLNTYRRRPVEACSIGMLTAATIPHKLQITKERDDTNSMCTTLPIYELLHGMLSRHATRGRPTEGGKGKCLRKEGQPIHMNKI